MKNRWGTSHLRTKLTLVLVLIVTAMITKTSILADENRITRNGTELTDTQTFKLGEQISDDREGCVSIVEGRRVGICNDGIYEIDVTATDGAGNTGEKSEIVKIERDTVAPAVPEGELEIDLGRFKFDLNISGEKNSLASVEVTALGMIWQREVIKLDNIQKVFNITSNNWYPDTEYLINLKLIDRAGNESEIRKLSYTTPRGNGSGGVQGVKNDPWASNNSSIFNSTYNAYFTINQYGEIALDNIDLPLPILTYTNTSWPDGYIDVFGISTNKNQVINIKPELSIQSKTLSEISKICKANLFNVIDVYDKRNCFSEHTNVAAEEVLGKYLEAKDYCTENAIEIFYKECLKNYHIVAKKYPEGQYTMNLENVEINLYRNNNLVTELRTCPIGQPCHNDSRRYWNDNELGRFNLRFDRGILNAGEILNATYTVYGNFDISFEGKDYGGSFNNLESQKSNDLSVKPMPTMFEEAVHPLAYDANCAPLDTVYTGPNGDDDFGDRYPRYPYHIGIDIRSLNGGYNCLVNTVARGIVNFTGTDETGANYIDINHQNGYVTRYVHGADSRVYKDQFLSESDFIALMGCTGLYCSGRHLHFELYENGVVVDPMLDQFFGYMGGDGSFYLNTKKY